MKAAKYLVTIAILAGVGYLIIGSINTPIEKKSVKKTPRVEAVRAKKIRMLEQLETTGDVVATNTVMLEATIEGPISFCPWREGDIVKEAGEKLIVIDRPLYQHEALAAKAVLAVAQAKFADLKAGARPEEIRQAKEAVQQLESNSTFALADLKRVTSLVESGALSKESLDKAQVSNVKAQTDLLTAKEQLIMLEAGPTKTEIAIAQAEVDMAAAKYALAQSKLEECFLRAPFAGIITEVFARKGDLATPRAPLLKIMDPTSLVVRAGFPEKSVENIKKGAPCTIKLDAYANRSFSAKIVRVYPRIEFNSRTRIVEARITDPVKLIPRMFARITAQSRVIENAIVVPDAAVVTTPRGDQIVYVIRDNVAHLQKVTIGFEQESKLQIISGLSDGDLVATVGNMTLKDGQKVEIANEKQPSGLSSTNGDINK